MIREVLDQKHGGNAQARNETFSSQYRPPPAHPSSALAPGGGASGTGQCSFTAALVV